MRLRVWLSLGSWLAIESFSPPATPCGAFVAPAMKTVPSLAVEQTLIVFDATRELEHFVRQIAIRDPSPGFGFVVPVPEKPIVAKVKVDPFAKLAKEFPLGSRFSVSSGGGAVGGGKAAAGAVTVFSREKVGSFTAFVLAASEATALEKWFSDNHLRVPSEAEAWLLHYVKLGFYFVAMRYETQERDVKSAITRAETIRVSFQTPLPFYPYREPMHTTPSQASRDLVVWLFSTRAYTPVSLFEPASATQTAAAWQRPMVELRSETVVRQSLASVFSEELLQLLPHAEGRGDDSLAVQVFEDQKHSREGFGDIVMVPKQATALSAPSLVRSRKLMASLDPAVAP